MPTEPTERDRLAIARGHPPEAHRVVCVDFDGVLYPFGMLMEAPAPMEGAVRAMQRLRKAGYRIVILTSRLSTLWLRGAGQTAEAKTQYIAGVLDRDGIPWDDITAEKVPAEAYIDDKAIRFNRDWPSIVDWLLWSGEA